MQTTTNYGLKKPEDNEVFDQQEHANYNMETVDAALTPTGDPTQAPTGNGPGKLIQWVSWFANRIKAITGKTNWCDAPDITLAAAKTSMDDYATHKGNTTNAHGAVTAAIANKIVIRDATGRAKVAPPSAEDEIALKSNVTAVQTNLDAKMHAATGHKHTGGAGDAPILTTYQSVTGTFSDITTALASLASHTKTIPLGTSLAKGGIIYLYSPDGSLGLGKIGASVIFTATANDAISSSHDSTYRYIFASPSHPVSTGGQTGLSDMYLGGNILLKSVYINGSNLVVEFQNGNNPSTLNVQATWVVF